MEKTEIKAIDMTRRIRERHYEQIQGKTHEDRVAFYRAKAQALHVKAQALLQGHQASAEACDQTDRQHQ